MVAAAGYGKTTALLALAQPGERRPLVHENLDARSPAELDDILDEVRAAPPEMPIILTSRAPLAATTLGTLPGVFRERGPDDLSLPPHRIATVLRDDYGVTDVEAGMAVHECTRGWPSLVHFAADALARDPNADLLASLTAAGTPCGEWLRTAVLPTVPPDLLRLLGALRDLDPLHPELWQELTRPLGSAAPGALASGLTWLRRVGLVVPTVRGRLTGGPEVELIPIIRALLAAHDPEPTPEELLATAANWYAAHGYPFGAARLQHRAGRSAELTALLAEQGGAMLAAGDARGVVALADADPGVLADDGARGTVAEALHLIGQPERARTAYAPLVTAAEGTGWDPLLSRRLAALTYSEGDLVAALEQLDRVSPEQLGTDVETAIWFSVRANITSFLGLPEEARTAADRALELADASGSPRARVHAHLAQAKVSSGVHKEAHLSRALAVARGCGDVVDIARILGNQGYTLLSSARFAQAVPVCRDAAAAAHLARPTGAQAVASLHNLAEALMRVGDVDEARWQLHRAIAICQRSLPGRAGTGLLGLGELHRSLGQSEQARTAYEQAIAVTRASGELQVLVPALAGLARVLMDTDRSAACRLADEAISLASGPLRVCGEIAAGWVALLDGECEVARDAAERAIAAARSDGAIDLLADGLELAGAAAAARGEVDRARQCYDEAHSMWRDGGATVAADRIEVARTRLPGSDAASRSRAREAARRLRECGIREVHGQSVDEESRERRVAIRVLGGFTVRVDGAEVQHSAWRSRQARTLVKILASRPGRAVSRAYLCETLWPDDDPSRTSHRLSVLLTTVRGVLDPAKAHPPEHSIAADSSGLWLDLRHVSIDADDLIADAHEAMALLETGETARAREILRDVDRRYRGEAFEDEPFTEWADIPREETRAAWLRGARHLALSYAKAGQVGDAEALFTRLLLVDPYDERVHRARVRNLLHAGRHGEARRAFHRWTEAMTEIGASRPDPALVRPF